jgi:hypothetical protein
MRLEFSGPSSESLNGKRQSFLESGPENPKRIVLRAGRRARRDLDGGRDDPDALPQLGAHGVAHAGAREERGPPGAALAPGRGCVAMALDMAWCSMAWHLTWHGMAWHGAAWHGMAWRFDRTAGWNR